MSNSTTHAQILAGLYKGLPTEPRAPENQNGSFLSGYAVGMTTSDPGYAIATEHDMNGKAFDHMSEWKRGMWCGHFHAREGRFSRGNTQVRRDDTHWIIHDIRGGGVSVSRHTQMAATDDALTHEERIIDLLCRELCQKGGPRV